MRKRKYIIAVALLASFISNNSAFADNSLLQMEVKKSGVADTVDVTFYTTAEGGNSVVTRKSNNKYVVLLPNTTSSGSIAPGLGGVKDLITDIDVKNVNDGMGGYTKVTFGTTKPINIKTRTQKTNPLTQAQKDSQALIAKYNTNTPQVTKPQQATQAKPQTTTTPKVKATAPQKTQVKPAVADSKSQQTATKSLQLVQPNKNSSTASNLGEKLVSVKTPAKKVVNPTSVVNSISNNEYVPKMKYDNNGQRLIDLEPRVSHQTVSENSVAPEVEEKINEIQDSEPINQQVQEAPVVDTNDSKSNSMNPYFIWLLCGLSSVVGLGVLFLIFDSAKHSSNKESQRLESFYTLSNKNSAKRKRRTYYDIANNEDLSWQEKYKLYNEKENTKKVRKNASDMSYVTEVAGLKQKVKEREAVKSKEIKIKEQISHENIVEKKLKDKMAEIEEKKNKEIAKIEKPLKVNTIKLKSFSNTVNLKERQSSLLEADRERSARLSQGLFTKVKKSTIETVNAVKSIQNKEDRTMAGNYENSSLEEYLSILGDDIHTISISEVKDRINEPTPHNKQMTNPIAGGKAPVMMKSNSKPIPYMSGLIVKSGYNINNDKGFYMVNMDGVSALVGRVKDSIYVLKKFDKEIDTPIQVRPDSEDVYIVRVGSYKCLVDVSQDRMGTLIEI